MTTRGAIAGAAILMAGCAGHDDSEVTATTTSAFDETAVTTARSNTTVGPDLSSATTVEPLGTIFVSLGYCATQTGLTCTGGYWVREINSAQAARRVSTFDVSNLGSAAIAQANGGGDALIFRGRFGPVDERDGATTFVAFEAWRGLPDVEPPAGDPIVTIANVDGALFAAPLNESSEAVVDAVSVSGFAPPLVDTAWLTSRVLARGALVAGQVHGTTFDASQVFVRLPDGVGPCSDLLLHCAGDETPTFERDGNLCLIPTGCVVPRACPLDRPVCGPGYVLASWPSQPGGCLSFACDAAFLTQ